MKHIDIYHFFSVLGNPQRVKIIQLLDKEGEMNVSQIAKRLKVEQSNVSHDMRRLLLCHFVYVKRDGKERVYSINTETIRPLLLLIEEHVEENCVKGCVHWE